MDVVIYALAVLGMGLIVAVALLIYLTASGMTSCTGECKQGRECNCEESDDHR